MVIDSFARSFLYHQAAESEAQRDQILNDHKSVKETFDVILDTDKYKALLARG